MMTQALNLTTEERPAIAASGTLHRPPVVIMNLFYSGVGIARDLAGCGIRVIGFSADPKAFGNYSRCCELRRVPKSKDDPEQLLEYFLKSVGELSGAVVFPTRDADVLFLDRYRGELETYYRLAIPSRRLLPQVMNKETLVQAAKRAGVPFPRTRVVRSIEEVSLVADEVGYPCVVKPVSSNDWHRSNNWDVVGGRKAFRVDSEEQLRQEYVTVSAAHPQVLVQEWIPGSADQIFILGGYIGRDWEPLAYFTARKIVQDPDDFGTGCLVESTPVPQLRDPSFLLLRELRYQGMCEIEYKRDPRSGQYKLIEINTRHWDQHRLGQASGINLSWIAYRDILGEPVEPSHAHTATAKWVGEDAMLTYVLRALYYHKVALGDVWKWFSAPRVYGIFSWSDPAPWVRYLFGSFLPRTIRGVVGRVGLRRGQ